MSPYPFVPALALFAAIGCTSLDAQTAAGRSSSSPSAADRDRPWQLVNPGGGGQIQDLRADPNTPDTLYLTSDMEGGYRTRDGGLTWEHITYGTSHSMAFFIEAEPGNSMRLYCGHMLGLDISDDGGRTWSLHPAFGQRSVGAIAINPKNPAEIYVGHSWRGKGARYNQTTIGPRVIHVSKDHGKTFTAVRYEPVDGVQQIEDIVLDPDDPQIVTLGGHAGIYRSTDGGQSWSKIPVPIEYPPVPATERAGASNARSGGGAIALSPDGQILYACFNNKQTFAARVNQWEWIEIGDSGFSGRLVPLVRVSPFTSAPSAGVIQHRIFVGTEPGSGPREGLVTWSESGAPKVSWREAASLSSIPDHGVYTNYVLWTYGLAFAPKSWAQGERVWISGGHSIYVADLADPPSSRNWVERYSEPVGHNTDGARTYVTRGFDNTYLWEIEKHGRYVVQALADMFMFESYDGGGSWVWTRRTSIGLQSAPGNRGYSAEIIKTDPALVLVCAVGELIAKPLVNFDASDKWKVIGGGLVPRGGGLNRQGPGDENRPGAPGSNQAPARASVEASAAPAVPPAINGLPAGPMQAIVSDPHDPKRVYVGTANHGVYVIDDIVRLFNTGQGAFVQLNAGTPLASGFVRNLAVDPLDPDVLYVLCTGTSIEEDPSWTWTGVWKGVRKGGEWTWKCTLELERRLNSDLQATSVAGRTAVVVSGRPRIQAATSGSRSPDGQVFVSTDNGETWKTVLTRADALGIHPARNVTPSTAIEMTGIGVVENHVFISVIADEQKNGVSYLHGLIAPDGGVAWSDFTDNFYYPRAYRTNIVRENGETWLYVATMGSGAFRRNITDLFKK
jgi:photosystem II stability/assembly factor-like uncharacterized protein